MSVAYLCPPLLHGFPFSKQDIFGYLLRPDSTNFAKRLVKTPKLYFYDTGLACSLLDIRTAEQVSTHYLRGGLFENMVINSFIKQAWNSGQDGQFYFWRDSQGTEIDLLSYVSSTVEAYEIKSGATFVPDFFKGLRKWSALSGVQAENLHVIYGGERSMNTSHGQLLAWNELGINAE